MRPFRTDPALHHHVQWPGIFVLLFVFFTGITRGAEPKEPRFASLRVEKEPGHRTGTAVVTIQGKRKRLARHVTEAWPVMKAGDALVITQRQDHDKKSEYQLHFFDGETLKSKTLGSLPFPEARLLEKEGEEAAFILEGQVEGKSVLVAADNNGTYGRIEGASSPRLEGHQLTFTTGGGARQSVSIAALLGTSRTGIYEAAQSGAHRVQTVQFQRNGLAVLVHDDGTAETQPWTSNGTEMMVTRPDGTTLRWRQDALRQVSGIPAGTRLDVRLAEPLSSWKAKEDDPVHAELISPARVEGSIYLPQGTVFSGKVTQARAIGWGVRRETAALTVEFDRAKLPDGRELAVQTRLFQVENAQEKTENGTIRGIRSTATPGQTMENRIASVGSIDPVLYLFTTVSGDAALGFAEPEILYPAGTELIIELSTPLRTAETFSSEFPRVAAEGSDHVALEKMVEQLPFRTVTAAKKKVSDITNLILIGPREGVMRAFEAAGWLQVDQLTAGSTFMTLKTVGGNQVYRQAPMSMLVLEGKEPLATLSKTTNTFNARHHLRLFDPGATFHGDTVLTASSTQDIGIAFSRKAKTFIHVIDEYIDNERSKVVNDLEFTGCVTGVELVPRPWVPLDAYNSTGDRLRTDGAAAILRINDCQKPRSIPDLDPERPNRFRRIVRNTMLTLKDDLYRGNLIYQGIAGTRMATNYLSTRNLMRPDHGAWRATDDEGNIFQGVGAAPSRKQEVQEDPDSAEAQRFSEEERALRWEPPRYEVGVSGIWLNYPGVRQDGVVYLATPIDASKDAYIGALGDELSGGWGFGITFTVNSWKWFSNQFNYTHTFGTYNLALLFTKPDVQVVAGNAGLITRQFDYNLVLNLRPPRSRWRPYIAAGPAVLLTALSDAPVKRPAGPFRLGLQNLGVLLAAFDFGRTPPLDGGGIFSPGFVYGGGIKFRVHPRFTVSADYRETVSRNPQFISESYTADFFSEEGYTSTTVSAGRSSTFRQQRLSLGFAFTF